MTKTSDLVKEMQEEAKTAWLVAIAVGYHNETKFVLSSSENPLQELDTLVKQRGFPIGLLRFEKENNTVQGSYRPFKEYESVDWVGNYLAGLLEHTDAIIGLSQHQEKSV
jgi:hypothetical protein